MAKSSFPPPTSKMNPLLLPTSRRGFGRLAGMPLLCRNRPRRPPERQGDPSGLCKCYACKKQFTVRSGPFLSPAICRCICGCKSSTSCAPAKRHFDPPDSAVA